MQSPEDAAQSSQRCGNARRTASIALLRTLSNALAKRFDNPAVPPRNLAHSNGFCDAACKSPHEVVAGFEDVDPRSVLGAGDVKYHIGATGTYLTPSGKEIGIHLVSNPSHLEAVDPVAVGRSRAAKGARQIVHGGKSHLSRIDTRGRPSRHLLQQP